MIPIRYNIRSLAARRRTTLAAGGGIALAVFVFSAALMLAKSITSRLSLSGRTDQVILLRQGSESELTSVMEDVVLKQVLTASEIAVATSGAKLAVGEVVVVAALERTGGGLSNLQIRGVPADIGAFRSVEMITGRAPNPGTTEAMVGRAIAGRFQGASLGGKLVLGRDRPLEIVGVFADRGSQFESEVWADLLAVQNTFGRESLISSIRVRLRTAADYPAFQRSIEQENASVELTVNRESDFYARQSESLATLVLVLGIAIGVLLSLGAMIGAAITMHTSVSRRKQEIATLRAIGFSPPNILFAFMLESAILAFFGGVMGAAFSLALSFLEFSTVNSASWSEVVFGFEPTLATIASALGLATAIGLAGGLFPAVRAMRVPVVRALRE